MEDKEKIIGPRINVKYSKKSIQEILFNWIMANYFIISYIRCRSCLQISYIIY